MKYLVVLAVVLFFVMLIAVRYRRQISAAIVVGRMIRDAGQGTRQIQQQQASREPMAAEPLVKCSSCGTWVPGNRAQRLQTGDFFCSNECLRSKAKIG